MMTREDRQEALSLAYVHAVAAACGMTHSVPSKDYGIDISLHAVDRRRKRFYQTGWHLDLQVKSTTSVTEARSAVSYDLSRNAYDDLRLPFDRRRMLIVAVFPADEKLWLRQSRGKLELRQSVYWISLRGYSAVSNRSSIRVAIPKRQLFTAEALSGIMDRIRAEEGVP
jgi:hypothetical protein